MSSSPLEEMTAGSTGTFLPLRDDLTDSTLELAAGYLHAYRRYLVTRRHLTMWSSAATCLSAQSALSSFRQPSSVVRLRMKS